MLSKVDEFDVIFNVIGIIACIAIPVFASIVLGFTVLQSVVLVIGPFTPILAVVIDEWLTNKQSVEIADQLTRECHNTWTNILSDKLSTDEINLSTQQHMRYWQNFRQSATPVFEWLYKVSRERMEGNMLVDTDQLILNFNNRKRPINPRGVL